MNNQFNSETTQSEFSKNQLQKPPKINGFTQKMNVQQILSYLMVTCLFFVFTFCILPTLTLAVQIVSGILYYGSFIVMFILGYICTTYDPTDQHVIKEKTAKLNNQAYDSSNLEFYCINCVSHVSNNSKHCKACNRCVADFDHHCKWLNNCVGQTNYSLFFKLITIVLINTIIFAVFGCIALFVYYFGNDKDEEIVNDLFFIGDPNSTVNAFETLLWVFLSFGLVIVFFDGNLVFFHIYLRKMKLTTYQYIMTSREKKSMEGIQKKERQEQRQRQKEEEKRQKIQKQKEIQILRQNSQSISIFGGNTQTQKPTNKQNSQSSQILTPQQQNSNSINFQNQAQNTNFEDRNIPPVSRQDSLDTHSQRTNHFEFTDSRKGTSIKGIPALNSQFNLKKSNKKGFWEKICCCFKSKQNEAKIGVVGLTKIDEQSEFMDEKEEQNENFAVIEEMNQRGICQTIDVMEEVQKMKPIESNKQINIDLPNPEIYFQKATNIVANNKQLQIQTERVATEEVHLKDLPQELLAQRTQTEINNQNHTANRLSYQHKKSGLDVMSVNLTQKSNEPSPEKQSLKEDDNSSIKNESMKDVTQHKKQHIPPKNLHLYLRSSSKSSSKSNQQSSHGDVLEVKTEEKHNSIPPSQIMATKVLTIAPIKIKQNSTSLYDIQEQ